jgi:DNA-binding transcriptional LysR family regulator
MRGWREIADGQWAANVRFVLECDDCDGRRLAVLSGLGIALMPNWSVGDDIGAGRLVELTLSDAKPNPESGIYLLRALPRANARIRAFAEHLQEHIGHPESPFQISDRGHPMGSVSADGMTRSPSSQASA